MLLGTRFFASERILLLWSPFRQQKATWPSISREPHLPNDAVEGCGQGGPVKFVLSFRIVMRIIIRFKLSNNNWVICIEFLNCDVCCELYTYIIIGQSDSIVIIGLLTIMCWFFGWTKSLFSVVAEEWLFYDLPHYARWPYWIWGSWKHGVGLKPCTLIGVENMGLDTKMMSLRVLLLKILTI